MLTGHIVDPTASDTTRFRMMHIAVLGSASNPEQQFDLMQVAAKVAAEVAADISSQEDMPTRAQTVGHTEAPAEGDELPRVKSA
jgi:hypothetical protein